MRRVGVVQFGGAVGDGISVSHGVSTRMRETVQGMLDTDVRRLVNWREKSRRGDAGGAAFSSNRLSTEACEVGFV